MAILLECQKCVAPSSSREVDEYDLLQFTIYILCGLLEIVESDITAEEERRIQYLIKDWRKPEK